MVVPSAPGLVMAGLAARARARYSRCRLRRVARGTRVGVTTSAKLNRQDYHLSFNKTLESGGLVVGDEVKIEISLEATPAAPKTAAK